MQDASFFTKHYELIEDVGNILMTAMVLIALHLAFLDKIILIVAASVIFIWMSHVRKGETALCGAEINADAIARPWQVRDN
jgi:hypothetical protein